MKILWVVNKCCGALNEHIYGTKSTGGLWLDATLADAQKHPEDQITVVNVLEAEKSYEITNGNIRYYTVPGKPNEKYDFRSSESVEAWRRILLREKPDIIQLWGTEFPYGLAVMEAASDIPIVVYAQGILDSIAKYYRAGLSEKELQQAKTLRDLIRGDSIRRTQRNFEHRAEYEAQIIRKSGHVIIENQWAYAYYQKMCPDVTAHFCSISISESFSQTRWQEECMQSHTILCSAANYPIKGLHMLLKALALVKKNFPDVKLFVPGTKLREGNSLKSALKQNGYERLICKMITELGLEHSVHFTGRLTAEQMAEKMASVNCFVMCSAIENHSSTLKEAMTVGVPSVASTVGGVPEYAFHERNALMYRFEDYEVLAYNIQRIFQDLSLRKTLSQNALNDMRKDCNTWSDYEKLQAVYRKICNYGLKEDET